MTIKEAADLADVSERSVLSARALLGTGDSEAIAAVERGEMAVSKALRLVRSTPGEAQLQHTEAGRTAGQCRAAAGGTIMASRRADPGRSVV